MQVLCELGAAAKPRAGSAGGEAGAAAAPRASPLPGASAPQGRAPRSRKDSGSPCREVTRAHSQPSGAKRDGCPRGAGGGNRAVPRVQVWRRCGWGWELSWVHRRGDGCPRGADGSAGVWGLRCCPVAMLTAAPGPKVPSCVTAVLPQASRGCLLCSFGDRSALTQLTVFPSAGAAAHAGGGPRPGWHRQCWHQSPGHLPGTTGAAGEATECLARHTGTTAVAVRCGHQSRCCPTARGAGAAGDPSQCSAPAPAKGHKPETPRELPAPKAALAPLSLSRWLALGDL